MDSSQYTTSQPYAIPNHPRAINVRRLCALLWRMHTEVVLAERHAAWRGCSERGVWLPLRLACAVTGLLRCQVTRAAWRLQAMAPGPETADELAMAA